jgi:hypothetical protein
MDNPSTNSDRSVPVFQLIAIPALITLVVTIVRLMGELQNWSSTLFGKAAGGGGSLVGIAWLVPIFGVYFAYRLIKDGHVPASGWRVLGISAAAFALLIVSGVAVGVLGLPPVVGLTLIGVVSIVAIWLVAKSWPALGRTLLAYGFAARIPVVVVMLIAMLGDWGTHYDVPPPDRPEIAAWNPYAKWFVIGVLPQFTIWIAFTLIVGGLFAAVTALVMRRSRTSEDAPGAESVA